MDSIIVFWNQMTGNPLLFLAVTLTLGVILVNGFIHLVTTQVAMAFGASVQPFTRTTSKIRTVKRAVIKHLRRLLYKAYENAFPIIPTKRSHGGSPRRPI